MDWTHGRGCYDFFHHRSEKITRDMESFNVVWSS